MILPQTNSVDVTPETRGSTLPFSTPGQQLTASRSDGGATLLSPNGGMSAAAPLADPAKYELTAEMLAEARGINVRNAREALRACPVLRKESRGGRPFNVFDVSDDARLAQTAERIAARLPACDIWEIATANGAREAAAKAAPQTDDLKIAAMRAEAVRDYLYWMSVGEPEAKAALKVCAAWSERQTQTISTTLRAKRVGLGGGFHERGRRITKTIGVGGFSLRTLRSWAAIWRATDGDHDAKLRALAPGRKGASGRKGHEIPQGLLDLVYSLLTTSCRADLCAALKEARKQWPAGAWPVDAKGREPGYDSWRRRMSAMDPNWAGRTLGTQGIAQHQWKHTPDISIDRSGMGWNDEWTLDDVTQDWYAVNTLEAEVFRPRLYVLQRVATRQWICAVASIDPITGDQVRAMVGSAMASPNGGIPRRITFENGAVACDDTLANLLDTLGIKVRKTSMIGGSVIRGGTADRATGNFPGKATIESAIKQLHRFFIFQPGQVGGDERLTAPARLETLKRLAEKAAADGTVLPMPTQDEMHGIVRTALNAFNDTPHGGLKQIVDASGQPRHATPNEAAKLLRAENVRVLDSALLPLFYSRGTVVTVSRNGIRLANEYYGRFDEDVLALRGRSVHCHANPDDPSMIYVTELDRCVERFAMPKPGDDLSEFYRTKKTVARRDRNLLEARYRSAIAAGGGVTLESLQFTANPTPDRVRETVANVELAARLSRVETAQRTTAENRTQRTERAAGFTDRRASKYDALLAEEQPEAVATT